MMKTVKFTIQGAADVPEKTDVEGDLMVDFDLTGKLRMYENGGLRKVKFNLGSTAVLTEAEAQKETAEKILSFLERQRFADWYNKGRFDSYITDEFPKGHPAHISREEIISDIIRLFGL